MTRVCQKSEVAVDQTEVMAEAIDQIVGQSHCTTLVCIDVDSIQE